MKLQTMINIGFLLLVVGQIIWNQVQTKLNKSFSDFNNEQIKVNRNNIK